MATSEPIIDLYVRLRRWGIPDARAAKALADENQPRSVRRPLGKPCGFGGTEAILERARAANPAPPVSLQATWARRNREHVNARDRARRAARRAERLEGIVIVELEDFDEAMA